MAKRSVHNDLHHSHPPPTTYCSKKALYQSGHTWQNQSNTGVLDTFFIVTWPFWNRAWAWSGAASKTLARRPCQQHWCPRHTFHCNLAVLASSVDLARRSLENAGAETSKCADTHCVLHLGHTAGRQANVRMLIVFCIHEGCRKTHFLLHFPIRDALCRSSAVNGRVLCDSYRNWTRRPPKLEHQEANLDDSFRK